MHATESFTEFGSGFFEFGNAGAYGSPLYAQSTTFSSSTPKATLTYDVTPVSSLYASAGKGFRLGGATTPNTNAACLAGLAELGDTAAPKSYGPDQLWSYELGSKSLVFEKTLSVNADVIPDQLDGPAADHHDPDLRRRAQYQCRGCPRRWRRA